MAETKTSTKTLIVLNPHAASGQTGELWKRMEPILWEKMGELVVAITERPEDVSKQLDAAYADGLRRVISVGGDGTNHALINALVALNERHPDDTPMTYGTLPVGTGRDWARNLGIPFGVEAAARWICEAKPRPVDIGRVRYETAAGPQEQHFLNVASGGIGGDISARVNSAKQRRAWTFLQATVVTLLRYRPVAIRVEVDGRLWRDGPTLLVAIANGTTFGRGMKIAPNASIDDGQLDVILVEGMSRARALLALRMLYDGSHLKHPAVHVERARQVKIHATGGKIGMELDGEPAEGQDLVFDIRPGLLQMLV